jgi:hypothetical protein
MSEKEGGVAFASHHLAAAGQSLQLFLFQPGKECRVFDIPKPALHEKPL